MKKISNTLHQGALAIKLKKKLTQGLSQHAVDIDMSALAKLTFYEYLVSALTGFRIKRVEFRENVKGFSRDKEKCLD